MKKKTGLSAGFRAWYNRQKMAFIEKYGKKPVHTISWYRELYAKRKASAEKGKKTRLQHQYEAAAWSECKKIIAEAKKMEAEGYTPDIVLSVINMTIHINDENYFLFMDTIEYVNNYWDSDEWVRAYRSGAWQRLYEQLFRTGEKSDKFWQLIGYLKQMHAEIPPSDLIEITESMYSEYKTQVKYTAEELMPVWEAFYNNQMNEYIEASEWAPPALPLSMFNIGGLK